MRKERVGFLSVFLLLLVSVGSVFGQDKFSTASYDTIAYINGMQVNSKNFVKGGKMRLETNHGGMSTIVIYDGQKFYSYMPQQNMAMVIPGNQAGQGAVDPSDYKKDTQYVGDEIVDGIPCEVRRGNTGSMRVWISKATDFPVKVESGGSTIYFKNPRFNISLDDSLFALPSGTQVQDMGSFMSGMGGGMGSGGATPDMKSMQNMLGGSSGMSSNDMEKMKQQLMKMKDSMPSQQDY